MYGFEEIFTRLANGKTLRSDELMQVASLAILLWVGGAALVYALFIVGGGQSKQHCKEAEEELARLAERAKKQLAEKKQPKNGASKKQERQDDNLSDAAAKPSESRVSLFLGQLKHSDHDPSILLKCLERIIEYPDETKYQSINLSSKAFQENVWQKPSAKAVLIALGFKRTKTHVVLSSPGESLPFVESAAIFLKQMIEQKVAEQQVAAAAASQDTGGALPNIWGSGSSDGWGDINDMHSFAPDFNGPNAGGTQGGGSRGNGDWGGQTDGWDRVRLRNAAGWANGGRGRGGGRAPPPPSSNRRGPFG
jgi:hypothetical protein